MALVGMIGNSGSSLNLRLIMHAARYTPSLIIDCANSADPHAFFPDVNIEQMMNMYIIEVEMLYKFRDIFLKVPDMIRKMGIRITVITASDHLFNYQDEIENRNISQHSWELMRKIGEKHPVIVGVKLGSVHQRFAEQYCHRLGGDNDRTHSLKPAYADRYHHR
ncbi:hypothetical protein GF351_01970 [Candidatus Woesearchaeota archaeon]|nr:hypothetical protein [Candidatus Woesearchaeota archaeon]